MDDQQPTPVSMIADPGQRMAAPRNDYGMMDRALALTQLGTRLYVEFDDIPPKMEAALQHALNYLGVSFAQAVEAMEAQLEEDTEIDGQG
jgi:hypothetical protein